MLKYKIQNSTDSRPADPKKPVDPKALSDAELYDLCQEYGLNAKVWLRRFAGLLPEVNRRMLYRKKGFISIFEFAKKLCGMNEFTVERILNLSNRLSDKPALRAQFESGLQGWSKIEAVSFIATPKTEKDWAEKVEKMPRRVLETYVSRYRKEILSKSTSGSQLQSLNTVLGSQLPIAGDESQIIAAISQGFRFQDLKFLSFQVSREIEHKLRLFKQKLEKQKKGPLSWNEVFEALLEYTPLSPVVPPAAKSTAPPAIIPSTTKSTAPTSAKSAIPTSTASPAAPLIPPKPSASGRAIPAAIKNFLQKKYGTSCAYPNCNKPLEVYHHTKRFAITRSHDPKFIVPLCGLHHSLAHTGLIENEQDPPENWRIKEKVDKTSLTELIDKRMRDFKPD
ncbi:MAG: hypothetical protein ABIH78_00280 [Candidatus Peregrinibacteria bacterium]